MPPAAGGNVAFIFSFEESPGQLMRNMQSIGIDLAQWSKKNLLQFHSSRATLFGLEMHLAIIHKIVHDFQPQIVVIDPVGSLIQAGNLRDAHTMLIRLIDFLKQREVTGFLTNLTSGGNPSRKPTWRSPPSWIPGCSFAPLNWVASATAPCTF